MVCRGLVVSSHDCSFVCDCFVLNFAGFGIILGMDWLRKYAAKVDCERLEVTVENVEGRKVVIRCKHEEGVFLSFMYSLVVPRDGLSSVPIVNGFEDVFDEVKGLPPHREIEFRIDLVERARPVVMPLRRMAPREQQELRVQVDDLLRKGFIQRSVSE